MSRPVQPAKGNYERLLEGPLHACPHCGKILNQHFAPGGADRITMQQSGADCNTLMQAPAELSIVANGIIDLFDGSEAPKINARSLGEIPVPVLVPERPPQHLVDSGDVFVADPSPQMIRRTEQHQAGQARPEKALTHAIHGMRPKEAPAPSPAPTHGQAAALTALDHPIIGGKVTIVVCCYGDEHENLHRRCLNSIVQTVPPSRMDLRIISNQVGIASTNYFKSLPVTKVYPDYKARRKYTAMRQVFWDEVAPIDTNYVVWFDDDSYALNPAWLSILAEIITIQKPQEHVGMYGSIMWHPLKCPEPKDPRAWFRNGPWFKNKNFRNRQGRGVPNGDKIHFCVGGFWAISTECLRASGIPDTRLNHNGGDICIGEQIYQSGFKMKQFNENKQYIHTSAAPRRGFHEKFLWWK